MRAGLIVLLLLVACKSKEPTQGGKRYEVKVEAGKPSRVRVLPTGGWKISTDFETRLELKAAPSGAALLLGAESAKVTDHEIVYSVPVAQAQSYSGTISFAICSAKKCIPIRESVAWNVN